MFLSQPTYDNYLSIYSSFDRKLNGAFLGNSVEVSYSLKVDRYGLKSENYPIQVIMRVHINGAYASSWGCMDNKDNCCLIIYIFMEMLI